MKKPKHELEYDQQDDLKEWVVWSMILSVLAIALETLSWIIRR